MADFFSVQSEESLIGCFFLDNKTFFKHKNKLSGEFFYDLRCRHTFETIGALRSKNFDLVTVLEKIKADGLIDRVEPEWLAEAINSTPIASHSDKYCEIVINHHKRRLLDRTVRNFRIDPSIDPVVQSSDFLKQVGEIGRKIDQKNDLYDIISSMDERTYELISNNKHYTPPHCKTPYQLKIYDGKFHIINAYSGVGKTTLVFQNIWEIPKEKKIVFYSIEMKKIDAVGFLYRTKKLKSYYDMEDLYGRVKIVDDLKRWSEIEADVYSYTERPDIIFVDYLQCIRHREDRSQYESFKDLLDCIREFTKESGVAVVMLSQVSEAGRRNSGHYSAKGGGDAFIACDYFLQIKDDPDSEEELRKNGHTIMKRYFITAKDRYGKKKARAYNFDDSIGLYTGLSDFN